MIWVDYDSREITMHFDELLHLYEEISYLKAVELKSHEVNSILRSCDNLSDVVNEVYKFKRRASLRDV